MDVGASIEVDGWLGEFLVRIPTDGHASIAIVGKTNLHWLCIFSAFIFDVRKSGCGRGHQNGCFEKEHGEDLRTRQFTDGKQLVLTWEITFLRTYLSLEKSCKVMLSKPTCSSSVP